MGYNPDKPMDGRISDLGPPYYENFFPPVIKANKGKWLWHEIIQPGVLMHKSETGDEVYTVRCGTARLVSVEYIREVCEIADKHCDGYLRFTTRNNLEFMVDSKDKVQPLLDTLASKGNKYPCRWHRSRCDQYRSHPGLGPLSYPGNRCFWCGKSGNG